MLRQARDSLGILAGAPCIPNGILVKCEVVQNSEKIWTYSRSRSSSHRFCEPFMLIIIHSIKVV